MRVVFIQATNPVDVSWSAPIGFGYLKAYVDKVAPGLADIKLVGSVEEALTLAPEVVGISAFSQDFNEARRIARRLRQGCDAFIVLGGKHISALPGTLPSAVDVGVIGEGEITFAEVLQALAAGRGGLPDAFGRIPGLVYRDGDGQLRVSASRDLVPDLDSLPMPCRQLRLNSGQAPYLFTSRGCPYRCSFCCSTVYWKTYRKHSARRVVQEMESVLREFPENNHIMFWDDLFVADRPRLRLVVEMAERLGLLSMAKITCTTVRANLVDSDLCSLLKRLNVEAVAFGAESGSDRILKTLKTGIDVETNQRALDTLAAAGVPATCSFIVGTPGETLDDVLSTYEFILRNTAEGKLAFYDVNVLTPMPGSQVWLDAERQGLVGAQMNWDRLRYFASRQTNVDGLEKWAALRRENQSIYLNEATLPEGRLMELMASYEAAVALARKGYLRRPEPVEEGLKPASAATYRACLTSFESMTAQSGNVIDVIRDLEHRLTDVERELAEALDRLREREAELAAAHGLIERIARGKVMRLLNALQTLRRKGRR